MSNKPPTNLIQEWSSKLIGKKITDSGFPKGDLPQKSRVVEPGSFLTRDFHEDRLNVHVDGSGKVTHLTQG